jgi:hypothetical protein
MTNLSSYFTNGAAGGMNALYKYSNHTLEALDLIYSEAGLTHTLPITPNTGDLCSVWDVSDNAGSSAITVLRNGETIMGVADDFSLNMNGGRVDFLYSGTTWKYSYVVQTVQNSASQSLTVSRDITGTTGTIAASDSGKVLYCSNASAQDIGIPDSLDIGTQFIIAWEGVGQPSVSMDGTDTIVGDLTPSLRYKRLHVEKRSATVWWGTA